SSLSLSPSAVARASTSTLFPYTTLFRSVGDAVFGMLDGWHGASCAEYVAVKAHQIAHKPDTIDFDDAASVALVGLTALQALRDEGNIKAGDKVCINGASGGVGTMAVQIAKIYGCHVTA